MAVATIVCVIIMLGMMRFASSERPDSLAAIMAFLATPGSSADAMATDAAAHARWTARFQAANESAEQDAVFALAAAISREGRIAGLDRLRARGLKAAANDANLIESLMDAVSRARLDGQIDGLTPTAGMVWLVTHTTVRATSTTSAIDVVLPAAKKRAATLTGARSRAAFA